MHKRYVIFEEKDAAHERNKVPHFWQALLSMLSACTTIHASNDVDMRDNLAVQHVLHHVDSELLLLFLHARYIPCHGRTRSTVVRLYLFTTSRNKIQLCSLNFVRETYMAT